MVIRIVLVAVVVILGFLYYQFKNQPPARAAPATSPKAEPYLGRETRLSDTEDLRIVVVPSPLGPELDAKCLIYRNTEYRQATFTCPDVRADDINAPERDR